MRGSYVFNNTASNNINRSFISTALISDSYNDDLRKYIFLQLDSVFKIYLIIIKLILVIICHLLLCFRLLK
jgi:hypothetical protein